MLVHFKPERSRVSAEAAALADDLRALSPRQRAVEAVDVIAKTDPGAAAILRQALAAQAAPRAASSHDPSGGFMPTPRSPYDVPPRVTYDQPEPATLPPHMLDATPPPPERVREDFAPLPPEHDWSR